MVRILLVIALMAAKLSFAQTTNKSAITLDKKNGYSTFLVNNKPFLLLGGELGNSSASDSVYMQPIWPKLKAMHLNTLLAPVYWELLEPQEGKFNFALIDNLIANARKNDIKLVLLWFGTWKNSMSCYAPAWVKKDIQRFPRAKDQQGRPMEILSAFSSSNLNADVKAFTALLAHIKQVDATKHTVIMVQVENEVGMLTDAREYTAQANELFNREVPKELTAYLTQHQSALIPEIKQHWASSNFATTGTWEQVFGKSLATDELFQAWYYAKYVNEVAAAGKKIYNLPMYVNAALNYKNVKPGQYPSAGPLPHILNIWQAAAPAIDCLSPDFYNPYFKHYNDLYTRSNNSLFIPEIRFDNNVGAKAFYAIGHYIAFGFSPFSIESTAHPANESIGKSYKLIQQIAPLIHQKSAEGNIDGALVDKATPVQNITLGKYNIKVSHDNTLSWAPKAKDSVWSEGGAIILQLADDEFLIAGTGIVATFTSAVDKNSTVGILQTDEGYFEKGKWIAGRRLNGDEDHQGRHVRIETDSWGMQRVKLYTY